MQDSTGARVELDALRGRVGAMRGVVATLGTPSEFERARHLTTLSRQIEELDQVLVSQLGRLEDGPRRIPCPFCQQMIMPAATLCGFCWRKQNPKASGHITDGA